MSNLSRIEGIKKKHYELYSVYLVDRLELLAGRANHDQFVEQVDKFLNDMCQVSTTITSTVDYDWLRGAVEEWQLAYSFLNISKDIQLPTLAHRQLRTSLAPISKKILSDEAVEQWIREKAYYISKDRKEQLLKRLQDNRDFLREIACHPDRIHEILGICPEHVESQKDWDNAKIHFANNVLDGTINFVRQIGRKSYSRLEQLWLEDVKQLKAYFIWQKRDVGLSAESAVEDYCQAAKEIEGKSVNMVVTRKDFKEVADYLKTQYLETDSPRTGDEIYRLDIKKCKNQINDKVRRLRQMMGEQCAENVRLCVENYMKAFYENIIPAVMKDNSKENILAVRKVILPNKTSVNYLLVNCFEMALVIYFFPRSVKKLFF